VTGAGGYLGSEVCAQAVAQGLDVVATRLRTPPPHGHAVRLDLRDDEAVHRAFLKYGPDVVVHTAYRQADDSLQDDVVRATRNVALASDRAGARLVHVSTDLVFDGEHGAPYSEEDDPRPISAYGQAKLEAEAFAPGDGLVVRTSLLYGKPGPQEALAARAGATFYVDEIRCPTRVEDLAAALLELAATDLTGILHVAAPDAVSRFDLAVLLGARDPQGAATPAGRARNVALDSSKAAALLATEIRGIRALLHS